MKKFKQQVKDIFCIASVGEIDEISGKSLPEEIKKSKDLEVLIKKDNIVLCFISGFSHKQRSYVMSFDDYNIVLREHKLKRITNV